MESNKDQHVDSGESDDFSSEDEENINEEDLLGTTPKEPIKSSRKIPTYQYQCIVCEENITSPNSQSLLEHMLVKHHLVVGDAEKISYFPSYLNFWHDRFKGVSIQEFCSTINSKPAANAEIEQYYLLSDILPEDKQIREKLRKKNLEDVISKQQEERYNPAFNRKCLFCREKFRERRTYFSHMFRAHGFNIGLADNLVNVEELLDILQEKIENNICLYCEKLFKNYAVLKLHMRKKKHFRINWKNTEYDKFYVVNYLEPGKPWEEIQKEIESEKDEDDRDGDWEEWQEDDGDAASVCLFCEVTSPSPYHTFEHAKIAHGFDFKKIQSEWKLDFYSSVRLINFIRYNVQMNNCPHCEVAFETPKQLFSHMTESKHCGVTPDGKWKSDDKFLLPVNEDDPLLRTLDDNFDDSDNEFEVEPNATPENVNIEQSRVKELQEAFVAAKIIGE